MRHINVPVFVPHLGCPNKCVFCDQRAISGVSYFSEDDASAVIDETLTTVGDGDECEIAFFGGSFTGIDRDLMIRLLDLAEGYVKAGRVTGIRMSTRPDYIDPDIIGILKRYTVRAVELGIQSMNDKVLALSKRGHTAADTARAAGLLRDAGIPFVGQMMVGLPGSTPRDEVDCAEKICSLGAAACRIYPTLVFRNTELCEMMNRGEYVPLTVDEAVMRSADALSVFARHGVGCLRIGLCDSERLSNDGDFVAGPRHDAMGELVKSEMYRRAMKRELDSLEKEGKLTGSVEISVPKGDLSAAVGHKGRNRAEILASYPINSIVFLEKHSILWYNIEIRLI